MAIRFSNLNLLRGCDGGGWGVGDLVKHACNFISFADWPEVVGSGSFKTISCVT
jgi:hypothetical protein